MLSQKIQDDLMTAYQKVHEEKRGHAAGDSDVEKQASQLASDVRYKAKGKVKQGASDEEKKKIFLQILGASPAPSAVKAMAKQKLLGEEVEVKEGSMYGITKGDGMSFPERLKKKAKKKKEKMKMEEENINELKSRTMLNYIDKASDSASKQLDKAKKYESKGKLNKAAKARLKMDKRESGIEMAKDKIMKRVEEEKKPLPTTKMYRKAGNLSRKALSKGLDSKEGSKAQKRSEKIVSTITTKKEKERMNDIGMMRNIQKNSYEPQGELVDEKKLVHGNYGNFVSGQKVQRKLKNQ